MSESKTVFMFSLSLVFPNALINDQPNELFSSIRVTYVCVNFVRVRSTI